MLCTQRVERLAARERRRAYARPRAYLGPSRRTLVDEQEVRGVVDERRNRQRIDRLERDRLDVAHGGPIIAAWAPPGVSFDGIELPPAACCERAPRSHVAAEGAVRIGRYAAAATGSGRTSTVSAT